VGHLSGDELPDEQAQNRVIAEIVELQRECYFENKNKESERRRKLREIIDRATPLTAI
jgi:hypothetical protein